MERLSLPRIDFSPLLNSPEFEATILKAFFFFVNGGYLIISMESRDVKNDPSVKKRLICSRARSIYFKFRTQSRVANWTG